MSLIDRIGDRVCTALAVVGVGYILYWHMLT